MLDNPNFDIFQWSVRIFVILVGVSIGVILLVVGKKRSKWLGVSQLFLSALAPILMGSFIYQRKVNGAVVASDWEQIAYELNTIQYGSMGPAILVGLYIALGLNTVLVIYKLLVDKKRVGG